MGCCNNNITTNFNGVPYLTTTNVTVTETNVDYAMGFRSISPIGLFAVRIANVPTNTDGDALPVTLTLNGTSRALTFFNGVPVTGADINGTGVILVYNDRCSGILQMLSNGISTSAVATSESSTPSSTSGNNNN